MLFINKKHLGLVKTHDICLLKYELINLYNILLLLLRKNIQIHFLFGMVEKASKLDLRPFFTVII